MTRDPLATVSVPAGYDAPAYCEARIHRVENPALAHRTQQVAMDGTQKVPVRWLPALRESAAQGIERPYLERALAAWLHYQATGRDDVCAPLVISDPGAQPLAQRLQAAGGAPASVAAALDFPSVFGREPWPTAFAQCLAALRRGGTSPPDRESRPGFRGFTRASAANTSCRAAAIWQQVSKSRVAMRVEKSGRGRPE